MSQNSPEKYTAEEWDYIRKRFFNSILNDTEIFKLGQNVGISWPFRGQDETATKYIDYDFDELQFVPGLVGKPSRIKTLMDIFRETLAFDDPFSDMVDTVEKEGAVDDTFDRILAKLGIPQDYPCEFIHLSEDTQELLKNEEINTLIELVNFGQNMARNIVVGGEMKSFLNSIAHKDEAGMIKHIPYRPGVQGLHLAEAIGLIVDGLPEVARIKLLALSDFDLNQEEQRLLSKANDLEVDTSIKAAVEKVDKVCDWFKDENEAMSQAFQAGGSPERFFMSLNDPRRERAALQLTKSHFHIEVEKKSGFLGKLFGH